MGKRIASLEDAPADAALIRQVIASAGHECVSFGESRRLLLALRDAGFDLLLLDWQMPDLSGREVLAWVRTHLDRRVPVMFLTCRDAEHDIVNALTGGADDYMVKPVRQAELAARIECLLRRACPAYLAPHAPLRLGDYAFDCATRKATCNGHPVGLTPKEIRPGGAAVPQRGAHCHTRPHHRRGLGPRDLADVAHHRYPCVARAQQAGPAYGA